MLQYDSRCIFFLKIVFQNLHFVVFWVVGPNSNHLYEFHQALIMFTELIRSVGNSPLIHRSLPSMIVAIMEEFCLLMQSLAKITLSQDFQDFHIAKPSNPVTKTTI